MASYRLNGKKVTVHPDGEIFVNGNATGLKQWKSDSKRYSNMSGQEQKDVKGQPLEDALKLRGLIWKYWPFFAFKILLNIMLKIIKNY